MTSAMVTKLNGIDTGATKTTIDSALSSTSTNPLQNKAIYSALSGKLDYSAFSDHAKFGIVRIKNTSVTGNITDASTPNGYAQTLQLDVNTRNFLSISSNEYWVNCNVGGAGLCLGYVVLTGIAPNTVKSCYVIMSMALGNDQYEYKYCASAIPPSTITTSAFVYVPFIAYLNFNYPVGLRLKVWTVSSVLQVTIHQSEIIYLKL